MPEVAAAARALLGVEADAIEARRGGGNNRVYRVSAAGRSYALKGYPRPHDDPRDRLRREFEALRFLRAAGEPAVPAALAADTVAGFALYEWIDGTPVTSHDTAEVHQALAFLGRLHAASAAPEARNLLDAAEAVFTPAELEAQVARRFARLEALSARPPALDALLADLRRTWRALAVAPAQPVTLRTLSPSDFGFHNALRRPEGHLTFLDFEYFGWDDPVKLVADVLWHPGMHLSDAQRATFFEGALRLYGADPAWEQRFARDFPRYGVRWALIVLNEFLPEAWERRVAAGRTGDWAAATAEQLAKAAALLERVRQCADMK